MLAAIFSGRFLEVQMMMGLRGRSVDEEEHAKMGREGFRRAYQGHANGQAAGEMRSVACNK